MSFKSFLSLIIAASVVLAASTGPAKTPMEDVWKYRTLDEAVQNLEKIERKRGPEHKETIEAMIIAGNVAMIKNAPVDSVKLFERALAILEKKRGKGKMNARILNVRSSLGQAYAQIGDYEKAAKHLEVTLKASNRLGEKALSSIFRTSSRMEASVGYMMAHRALADAYYELGEYEKTEAALNEFVSISTRLMRGASKAQLSQAASSQAGSFYYGKQDCQRALPYLEEERKAMTAMNMPAMGGWPLGDCYVQAGRNAEAEPILMQSLDGIEAQKKMVMSSANAAVAQMGPRYRESVEQTYRQLEAFIYLPLIAVKFAKGDTAAAKDYINKMDRLMKGNPNMFWMSYKMAFIQGVYDEKDIALDRFMESTAYEEEFLEFVYAIPSERTKLLFLNRFSMSYNGILSFIHKLMPLDQRALRFAMAASLNRKGLAFDAQSRANEAIVNSLDPKTRELWNDLNRLRALYAKLLQEELSGANRNRPAGPMAGGSPGQPPQPGLEQLQAQVEALEKKISRRSEAAAGILSPQKVTLERVTGKLPPNAAFVEIVRTRNYDWTESRWAGSDNYLAFVLRPESEVRLVDLGDADELDETVSSLAGRLTKIPANNAQVEAQVAAARELGERIWLPLAEAVGDADFVVISPDGSLNMIPFGALAYADGKFVIESRTITYISSGRDMIRSDSSQTESDLFLAADPSYDNAAAQPETIPGSAAALRSVDFSMKFSPLPGTGIEAEVVPELLPGDNKLIVTKTAATEGAVVAAKRPRVMHLATHGFFLKDQDASTGEGGQKKMIKYENPLVRSGLAFAGANSAMEKQSGDDGLLTALEVTAMDLHGTELVTLSACETASGESRTGEGVFGLRRAFALAGARNLLMSLWPVADRVTVEQMKTFYKLYGQGRRPAEALRAAQLETIAGLREELGAAPPSIWAPFILQGAPEKN